MKTFKMAANLPRNDCPSKYTPRSDCAMLSKMQKIKSAQSQAPIRMVKVQSSVKHGGGGLMVGLVLYSEDLGTLLPLSKV